MTPKPKERYLFNEAELDDFEIDYSEMGMVKDFIQSEIIRNVKEFADQVRPDKSIAISNDHALGYERCVEAVNKKIDEEIKKLGETK